MPYELECLVIACALPRGPVWEIKRPDYPLYNTSISSFHTLHSEQKAGSYPPPARWFLPLLGGFWKNPNTVMKTRPGTARWCWRAGWTYPSVAEGAGALGCVRAPVRSGFDFYWEGMSNSRSISCRTVNPPPKKKLLPRPPMTNSSISSQHILDALLVMDIIRSHIFCPSESGKDRIACAFVRAGARHWK